MNPTVIPDEVAEWLRGKNIPDLIQKLPSDIVKKLFAHVWEMIPQMKCADLGYQIRANSNNNDGDNSTIDVTLDEMLMLCGHMQYRLDAELYRCHDCGDLCVKSFPPMYSMEAKYVEGQWFCFDCTVGIIRDI